MAGGAFLHRSFGVTGQFSGSEGGGGGPPPPSFAFMNPKSSPTGTVGGWLNYTLRNAIANTAGLSGAYCRVTYAQGPAGGACSFGAVYVGIKGAGALDFASAPVQVLFGGSPTVSWSGVNAEVVSDPVLLSVGASQSLVVAAWFNSGSAQTICRTTGSGHVCRYKSGGNDTTTLIASGYGGGTLYGVLGIEIG